VNGIAATVQKAGGEVRRALHEEHDLHTHTCDEELKTPQL
jgi:hypothetical protein